LGVEQYTLGKDITLYKSNSISELTSLDCPEHAVAVVANSDDKIYYALQAYSSKPNEEQIKSAYQKIGSVLTRELRNSGVYTKELELTSSHPEVPFPKHLIEDFAEEKKHAFKACSLMWLWLVSEPLS